RWFDEVPVLVNVLNAFRHQRYFHEQARDFLTAALECSTPFGIKGTFTRRHGGDHRRQQSVLNAFRHQRYFHAGLGPRLTPPGRCSTPFGIKGTFTHPGLGQQARGLMCSTPFGIKGTFTRPTAIIRAPPVNLCSTPFGIKGTFTRLGVYLTVTSTVRAQRLSASKVLSPATGAWRRTRSQVLNAFRHQRYFHPPQSPAHSSSSASGAQRLSASKVLSQRAFI